MTQHPNPTAPDPAMSAILKKKGVKRVDASVMRNLPVPVLLVNGEREVIALNPAADDLVGTNALGRDLAVNLRYPTLLDAVDDVIDGVEMLKGEFVQPFPVRQHFEFRVIGMRPRKGTGYARAMIIFHDVTAIRSAEQMKADFVANVSHELRSPLSALIGFIETLQGVAWNDDEARRRFLAIMETEAQRMRRLINDLLSLSRLEAVEHVRPRGKVDIKSLLGILADNTSLLCLERNMTLKIDVETGLPPVTGESDELLEVFSNLVENGLKYGQPGTPIKVTAKQVARIPELGYPGIAVEVENQGEGIASEHIPRITERFYRVDKGRSRKVGGTGLGLAIVKHIVKRHRGKLTIRSVAGENAVFTVFLPATPAVDVTSR